MKNVNGNHKILVKNELLWGSANKNWCETATNFLISIGNWTELTWMDWGLG